MTDQTKPVGETPQQLPADATPPTAAEVPATFANQFYISAVGGQVRITFGEVVYGQPVTFWRTAVVLPVDQAYSLGTVIQDLLKRVYNWPPQTESTPQTHPTQKTNGQ